MSSALKGFGGEDLKLYVIKTGLPFYDALCLYGAIDLYIGLRDDVVIRDCGDRWKVEGRVRSNRIHDRAEKLLRLTHKGSKPAPAAFCAEVRQHLQAGRMLAKQNDPADFLKEELTKLEPALQSGIRGLSAADYGSMNSSSNARCKTKARLSERLLAYGGAARIERIGDLKFLPIFEGPIDLVKIVSPLRAWTAVPNPLCAQALMLLTLKTALWAEGYGHSLSALTYSKAGRGSFNYSGIIQIDSTAVGQIEDSDLCSRLYNVFRQMITKGWPRGQKPTQIAVHTVAVAEWLMQPSRKTLGPMIGAQEFLYQQNYIPFLIVPNNVKEVFRMTYPERKIDHEAVRALAKAASSAIYVTGKGEADPRKHWYNEVVALRNAPDKQAFRRRALTLIEQSRTKDDFIGTAWRRENFDPARLLESMGEDRVSFEEFRDCFRMYLIQESAPKDKTTLTEQDLAAEKAGAEATMGEAAE